MSLFAKSPTITLRPKCTVVYLAVIAAVLAVAHLVAQAVLAASGYGVEGFWGQVLARFDFDAEVSVPTWYSQTILLLAAGLAAYIAFFKQTKRQEFRHYWTGLAAILLYASIDEGASLHETLGLLELTRTLGIDSTFFRFGWVLVGLIAVGLLAAVFMRFWWRLPQHTRLLFAVSVSVYVAGSLGVEMISANYLAYNEWNSFAYRGLLVLLEEILEVTGVLLLIYTFMDYIASQKILVNVAIKRDS